MYKILLPTDYSQNSSNAIRYALDFFDGQACELTILHVQKLSAFTMDDLMSSQSGASIYASLIENDKERIKHFCQELQTAYPQENFTWQTRIDYDAFVDAINQEVERSKTDLIVMGTNGASGAEELLFGSNTLQVIRKVPTPTLIVPEGHSYEAIESVVFSASSCKELRLPQAEILKDILALKGAELHMLKILEEAKVKGHDCGSCLIDVLKQTPYKSHSICGVPYRHALSSYLQLNPSQLHAFFVETKTFMERLFGGSNLDVLKRSPQLPLLVMHNTEA